MANEFHAVGRRKSAVARVRLVAGEGKILINGRDIDEYFGYETLKMTVRQPINLTKASGYDVLVNVNGGGFTGQAGAIRSCATPFRVATSASSKASRVSAR